MKRKFLYSATQEAGRFLELVKVLEAVPSANAEDLQPGKEAAAVKRASLDLTRALARLRHET